MIAPWIYRGLILWGRGSEALAGLREIEFQSVFGRCVMIVLAAGLIPAFRHGGFHGWHEFGLARLPGTRDRLLRAFFIGFISMALLFMIGLLLGAYDWNISSRLTRVDKLLSIFIGSALVGFFEELLFRGLLFGILRLRLRFWPAAIWSSLLFALVHFAKPEPLIGEVEGAWDAGLRFLSHAFYFGHETWNYLPYGLTLVVMGLVLCRVTESSGSIWIAIGLHAGWVLAMRIGGDLVTKTETMTHLFGHSDVVAKTWMAFLLACLFLAFSPTSNRTEM